MPDVDDAAWENVEVTLEDGMLTLRLHSGGGPAQYTPSLKKQLTAVLRRYARDPEARVLILTGTGDGFVGTAHVGGSMAALTTAAAWRNTESNQTDFMRAILDFEAPMIAAINGPVSMHAEFPAMCDVVLATPDTTFQDGHVPFGYVPGDGAHTVWPLLIGFSRARHFLMTGSVITAQQAHEYGVVHEIVERGRLLERAGEIASQLAALPLAVTRGTRLIFANQMRLAVERDLGFGLAIEGIATIARD